MSPCKPSPCGFNAVCKEQHGAGSCTCLLDYIGNPYEGCRPECVVDTDCISTLACIQSKCQDPCPGTCGQFAECQVINHRPTCTCIPGYSGNPFQYCIVFRDIGTNFLISSSIEQVDIEGKEKNRCLTEFIKLQYLMSKFNHITNIANRNTFRGAKFNSVTVNYLII